MQGHLGGEGEGEGHAGLPSSKGGTHPIIRNVFIASKWKSYTRNCGARLGFRVQGVRVSNPKSYARNCGAPGFQGCVCGPRVVV
jgi:hypothetical protein